MSDLNEDPQAKVVRSPVEYLGLVLRGALMGVAEVIPGVSGGTIAFISGIYTELLESIARFGPESVGELWRGGLRGFWQGFWRTHNLGFLMSLALGMGLALVSVARLVKAALETAPPLVWAFFFGLIIASVVFLARNLQPAGATRTHSTLVLALVGGLGLLFGLGLSALTPATVDAQWWMLLIGGAVAVSAWILPGISGSLMLLLMGLYPAVLAAVAEVDVVMLGSLLLGCGIGLLLFARVLSWLLKIHRAPVLALLTGVMAGSLAKLWPWQSPAGALLHPQQYALSVGPNWFWGACGMLLLGMLAVALLARFNPDPE